MAEETERAAVQLHPRPSSPEAGAAPDAATPDGASAATLPTAAGVSDPAPQDSATAADPPPAKRTRRQYEEEEEEEEEEEGTSSHDVKATSAVTAVAAESRTPLQSAGGVERTLSSGSVSSELSSAASLGSRGSGGRLETLSPLPQFHAVPPAPPATPATHPGLPGFRYWDDGLERTIPTLRSVANASQLEQQQHHHTHRRRQAAAALLPEGPATPGLPQRYAGRQHSAAPAAAQRKQPAAASATATATSPARDDFADWNVGERYELRRILGRGSYGEVAQAVDRQAARPDASFVAIKRLTSPFEQAVDAVRLYREIHILKRLRHDCIIQLLGIIQPPTRDARDVQDLYMVFEYVDTDLYKLIMSPQYLTTEHIQAFLYQMLAGLKHIHSHNVIHRDLKPANILLNEDCSLKICDFGLARIVDTTSISKSTAEVVGVANEPPATFGPAPLAGLTRQLTKHVVTRWYRAPELILIQPYTSAVDIWSVGCILAELLSMQEGNVASYQDRQPLFPGGTCYPLSGDGEMNKDEKLDQLSVIFRVIGTPSKEDIESLGKANDYIASLGQIKGKSLESMFPAADPAALDLLSQMLRFNPKKRCTAEQALDHPFFSSIRRQDLERSAAEPLEGPDFLEASQINIDLIKQKTLDECLGFVPRVS